MRAGGQKMLRNVLQSTWKTEYAKSNNIWVTYTDDVNQDILAVIRTFSNLQKVFYEKHQGDNYQSCNYWIS